MITINPADAVTPPKRAKKEICVANDEELSQILGAVKDIYMEMPVFIAVSTGARLGEILGLQWKDVNLKKEVIHIRQALSRNKNGELKLSQPKTPKSRRAIEIGEKTVSKLKQHQTLLKEWKLAAGRVWQENNSVCCFKMVV